MHRPITAPLIITGLFGIAEFLWSVRLTVYPAPFSPGSAVLVVAGVVIYTSIATVGILLVRAPWARWLAFATVVATLVLGSLGETIGALAITATALSLVAIGGLAGPWLRIWLRRRPGSGAGPIAAALPLVALSALPLAGIAAPDALSPAVLAVAFAGPLLAWAYARAFRWGLWGLRVVTPALALIAAVATGGWGAAWLVAYAASVVALSWMPAAGEAQSPVQAPLPPARVSPRSGGEA
jgi:hypothetical protein